MHQYAGPSDTCRAHASWEEQIDHHDILVTQANQPEIKSNTRQTIIQKEGTNSSY